MRTGRPELPRRTVLAGGSALALTAAVSTTQAAEPFPTKGRLQQGGFLFGRTAPHAEIAVDGEPVGQASAAGLFVVGLDRDEPGRIKVQVRKGGGWEGREFAVAPTAWDIQRIDGLPPDQVAPTDPALLKRIEREAALKAKAFASRDATDDFKSGFILPVEGARKTSRFGGQRILNGQPSRPHYGVDLAVPVGTPIHAAAAGLVVLAEPDLHYEGGLTLIDHGQGLIGMYLHQSRLDVRAGERVGQGQRIGLSGATGRATGPHLCWRLKWRLRNLDPAQLVDASAP
jgi:murein DD-endopeptidase MepM/ murein hydrolase activator NlpD